MRSAVCTNSECDIRCYRTFPEFPVQNRDLHLRAAIPQIKPKQPGFDLEERPFFQPTDEKFDAEALRDWKAKAALPSYQPFL